jgi:hypothetical protein
MLKPIGLICPLGIDLSDLSETITFVNHKQTSTQSSLYNMVSDEEILRRRAAKVIDNLGRIVTPMSFKRSAGSKSWDGWHPRAGQLAHPEEAAFFKAKDDAFAKAQAKAKTEAKAVPKTKSAPKAKTARK